MAKEWELTDAEIYIIDGGDPKLLQQFGRASVCDAYKNIAKTAQKKLVEWINQHAGRFSDGTWRMIPPSDWQELCKDLGVE